MGKIIKKVQHFFFIPQSNKCASCMYSTVQKTECYVSRDNPPSLYFILVPHFHISFHSEVQTKKRKKNLTCPSVCWMCGRRVWWENRSGTSGNNVGSHLHASLWIIDIAAPPPAGALSAPSCNLVCILQSLTF